MGRELPGDRLRNTSRVKSTGLFQLPASPGSQAARLCAGRASALRWKRTERLRSPAPARPRAASSPPPRGGLALQPPGGSAPLTRGLNALPGQGTRGRARRRLLQPHSQEPESWVLPAPSKEHPAANSGRFQPGYGSSPSSGGCARVKSPRTPLTSSPSSFTLPACLSNRELVQKSFDAAVAPQSVTLIMKLSSGRLGQVHRAFLYKAYRGSPPSLKTLSSFLLFFFSIKIKFSCNERMEFPITVSSLLISHSIRRQRKA